MLSKRGAFHLLPHLDEGRGPRPASVPSSISTTSSRAPSVEYTVAHFEADDAAADDQHALRVSGRNSSAPVEVTMRGSSFGRKGSFHRLGAGGDDRVS